MLIRIFLIVFSLLLLACQQNPVDQFEPESLTNDYIHFESGQVRPLAITDDQQFLLATNTPSRTLDIFALNQNEPQWINSIPVGIDPVSVVTKGNYAWVVNHISDNMTVVELAPEPRVLHSIPLGDEPRDLIIAGEKKQYLYVVTAPQRSASPRLFTARFA